MLQKIPPSILRFLRYMVVGVSTLLFDLVLLYVLTEFGSVPLYIGTPLAFLVAVTINYAVSRKFVFKGTERPVHHGYVYFILIAGTGAAVITVAVTALVDFFHLYYLVARILVAGVVGVGNYLLNLFLNFRVVGKH